jgi:hypothetical protein
MYRVASRIGRAVAVVAAVVAGACQDVTVPEALQVGLLTPDVWSGAELRLRVTFLPPEGTYLRIGDDSIAFIDADDSTLSAIAPQANGSFPITLVAPAGEAFVEDAIRIYGFSGASLGPKVFGYPLPVSVGVAAPVVFVNGESSLVRLDLRSRVALPYAGVIHDPVCARGPGPTPIEGLLLLGRREPSGSCVFALWQMTTPAQLVMDSVPGGFRLAAQFDANHWLVSPGQHLVCLQTRQPPVTACRQFEEMNGIRFSSRGDRAFMYYGYSAANGVPVFSTATGDTAWAIHDATFGAGGAFTTNGDTLILSVGGGPGNRLLLLNATTGQRLATIPLSISTEDVLVDPDAPYVYVFGWDSLRTAHTLVFERPTMRVVGDLTAPHNDSPVARPDSLCYWCDNRLFLDAGSRVLYLLGLAGREGRATEPASIGRFDLIR